MEKEKKCLLCGKVLTDLPIITGMDFGHTCPTFTIPYGVKAEIDSEKRTFSILENALI